MKSIPVTLAKILALAVGLNAMSVSFGLAHEYWLEPKRYQIDQGDKFLVNLKNGVDFKGTAFPYINDHVVSFNLSNKGGKTSITSRDGNTPALEMIAETPGLNSLSYFNKPSKITFEKWEKFTNYLREEGAEWVAAKHLELGLPKEKVKELYSRCAKTLIQVGNAEPGQKDSYSGMPAEMVAEQNPYALNIDQPLTITLLWKEEPGTKQQVRVFEKTPSGDNGQTALRVFDLTTNAQGKVTFQPVKGAQYLLSSVFLQRTEGPAGEGAPDAHWESYWASLTFGVPR